MYGICIKDDNQPIGYRLYSGFKTKEGMSINPASFKEECGFYVKTFTKPDAKVLTCYFYLSVEAVTEEMHRIIAIIKKEGEEKDLPIIYAKHVTDIQQDLLNYR